MKLSVFVQGRDNNFKLLRIMSALAVLFSHSFLSVTGISEKEPLTASLGMTFGSIAADIFFIISGFLVTSSLVTRKSTLDFVWARVLRIYPALIVMVILSVFVLGIFFTSIPISSFLERSETHIFVLKNITLIFGVAYTLPGVFESIPFGKSVNHSLWTMPAETRLYIILLSLWVIPAIYKRIKIKPVSFSLLVISFASSSFVMHFLNHFYFHSENQSYRLLYMFFIGAAYFVLKEHISFSRGILWLAISCLLISALDIETFFVVYNIVLAYILFWIAYVPAGAIRGFNRLGDYSYSVYIYAFPIQQSIIALIPDISVKLMILASSVTTLFIAFLSWHFIEEPALTLKSKFVKVSRQAIKLC